MRSAQLSKKFYEIAKSTAVLTHNLYLKVNKNRNDFMKTPFGPKSNVIIVRISALLYNRAEILKIITLLSGPNSV